MVAHCKNKEKQGRSCVCVCVHRCIPFQSCICLCTHIVGVWLTGLGDHNDSLSMKKQGCAVTRGDGFTRGYKHSCILRGDEWLLRKGLRNEKCLAGA